MSSGINIARKVFWAGTEISYEVPFYKLPLSVKKHVVIEVLTRKGFFAFKQPLSAMQLGINWCVSKGRPSCADPFGIDAWAISMCLPFLVFGYRRRYKWQSQ